MVHTRLAGHESASIFFVSGMWYWYLLYRQTQSKWHFAIMNLHAILAFGSRFNNVLGMLPIWIWEASVWFYNIVSYKKWWQKFPWVLIWLPISIWIGVFLIFPYWWTNPISSIPSTLNHWGGDPKELFFGSIITTPWIYYIVYFMYQTPLLIVILGLFQFVRVILNPAQYKAKNIFLVSIFIIWFIWSFATIKQGGMRYLLPLYIPFSILVVMSVQQIFSQSKKLLIGFSIFLIIYLGIQVRSTYPFYLDYYN